MKKSLRYWFVAGSALLAVGAFVGVAYATHSWGGYHWARTANPFTLQIGDNVSSVWDPYLAEAISDWNPSSVLDLASVIGGTRPKNCRPTSGRVEACNAKYGNTGWLGIAQIWVAGGEHITQGIVKLNDTYFAKPQYNTPAWKRLVMCQEIAHTFGLDHQDENFSNANLGSCMDYTNDPDGPLSNEHPNQHDFDELEAIYAHLDVATTVGPLPLPSTGAGNVDVAEPPQWGRALREDASGRPSVYGRDLGNGQKVFTFVIWADSRG